MNQVHKFEISSFEMDPSVSGPARDLKRNPSPWRVTGEKRSLDSGKGTEPLGKQIKLRDLDFLCHSEEIENQLSESLIIKEATVQAYPNQKKFQLKYAQLSDTRGMRSGKQRENLEETAYLDQRSDMESNSVGHRTEITDTKPRSYSNHETKTPQIAEASVSLLSDRCRAATPGRNALSLLGTAACLSLGRVDSPRAPSNLQSKVRRTKNLVGDFKFESAKHVGERKSSFSTKMAKNHEVDVRNPVDLVNHITLKQSTEIQKGKESASRFRDQDQLLTYKNLVHLKSKVSLDIDCKASECGSSTDPLEETEPWRVWKEMKQNGFLSSQAHAPLHKGIPVPKLRSQSRKAKNDPLKKKLELAKKEQVNRFTKIAAPSGLLTELNPGIINHVRNSKQVHSIIEALVQSEKLEEHIRNRPMSQPRRGSLEINGRRKDLEGIQDSGLSKGSGISLSSDEDDDNSKNFAGSREIKVGQQRMLNRFSLISCSENTKPSIACTSLEREKDVPLQKQLPAVAMAVENASCSSSEELLTNQESVTSLSVKAAMVASQWLELLNLDVKGRLSALRRSKKRVRAMIQNELPSIGLNELSCNQENDPNFSQSSDVNSAKNTAQDMHMARWRTLFDQMDKALSEEGKKLETRLKQVKEMQAHCLRGLQRMGVTSTDGLQLLELSRKDSRLKKAEALERERAVRAAAASIYSTCNLVMTTENVSCF